MFPINGTTAIVVIPLTGESVSHLLPLVRRFGTLQDLWHVDIDHCRADLWDEAGNGTL